MNTANIAACSVRYRKDTGLEIRVCMNDVVSCESRIGTDMMKLNQFFLFVCLFVFLYF